MGGNQSYQPLPTRPAKLEEVQDPLGINHKVIAYGDSHQQALAELKDDCLQNNYPEIQAIPFHEGEWHCGLVRHPSAFKEKWLYNTVFFGTDKRTGRKCVWFHWNVCLDPGFISV